MEIAEYSMLKMQKKVTGTCN